MTEFAVIDRVNFVELAFVFKRQLAYFLQKASFERFCKKAVMDLLGVSVYCY